MKCPFCTSQKLKVNETRISNNNITRRRKECLDCKKRFTTYESINLNIHVIKKDGSKVLFDESKIKSSIIKSYDKRPFPEEKVDEIARKIVSKVYSLGLQEIPSVKIGNYVLSYLKKLDKLAYLRFSYVFHNYQNIENIAEEISKIKHDT